MNLPLVGFLPQMGLPEMIVVMVLAVLFFGKRLPEVGRSLGKGIIEFRKGLNGLDEDFGATASRSSTSYQHHRWSEPVDRASDIAEATVPKFELPSSAPEPQDAPQAGA